MGVNVSALEDRAIEAAGLADVLAARRAGAALDTHALRLRAADLLALGVLADRVRREEVGGDVRIITNGDEDDPRVAAYPRVGEDLTGLELLREIAVARVTGPRGARIRVHWTRCGLELAQVALGFGANELAGRIATKRGLPIADGELAGVGKKSQLEPAQVVKERELAGFVTRAGRIPVFVHADGSEESATIGQRSRRPG
jgi:hypothetical protein